MPRARETAPRFWPSVLQVGALWGAIAVFLALVGLVESLSHRQIVAGILSLAYALLTLIGFGAGVQISRRRGAAHLGLQVAGGAVAGAVAGGFLGLLGVAGRAVNLRIMFINAAPALYNLLSFDRGPAGWPLMILALAAAGAIGAAAPRLPLWFRRPVLAGLGTAFMVGLFQDLVQLMLQSGIRAQLRGWLFTGDGLAVQGAVLLFVLAAGVSVLWRRYRGPAGQWVNRLPVGQRQMVRLFSLALGLAAIGVLPWVGGLFVSQVLVLVGLYTLMGLGLNLEVGFAGLLDLGFVAFFAIGAYTVGLLTTTGPLAVAHLSWWMVVPIATVVSLLAGVLFGLPILRIRGDYLAIATLGFGEIIRLLVLSDFLRPWLGGSQGVLGIPRPVLAGTEFRGPQQLFYLTVVASALVAFVAARLRDSRLGRAWMAVREDEDVAEALGINTVNVKLLAYGIGGAFAGVSGAIFAVMLGSVFPHSFSVIISINVLALIIVGGMGSLPGVMVGSLALIGLPELLREFSDFRFLVYGAVLIVMMQFRPEGLWPTAAARRELHEGIPSPAAPAGTAALAGAKDGSG
jgi:branched-chain amino acid transport system permease protein